MIYQRIHDLLLSEGIKRYKRLYKASSKNPKLDTARQSAAGRYIHSVERRRRERGQTGPEYTRDSMKKELAGQEASAKRKAQRDR